GVGRWICRVVEALAVALVLEDLDELLVLLRVRLAALRDRERLAFAQVRVVRDRDRVARTAVTAGVERGPQRLLSRVLERVERQRRNISLPEVHVLVTGRGGAAIARAAVRPLVADERGERAAIERGLRGDDLGGPRLADDGYAGGRAARRAAAQVVLAR